MISRGWSFDLNRVTTSEFEFDIGDGLIYTSEIKDSMWSVQFYTKDKYPTKGGKQPKRMSLNGKKDEFVRLRDFLNIMIGDIK